MRKSPVFIIVVVAAFLSTLTVEAKLPWVKKAKPLDAGVTACISCHVNVKPKKGEALNERGQWLIDEKARRTAEQIDLAWLKDFPKNGQDVTPTNKTEKNP